MDPIAIRPVVAVMVPPKPGAKPREVLVDLETVRVIITAFADARTALTAAQAALDACKALDAMQAAALEEAKPDTWTKAGPEYPDVSGGGVPYPAQPFGSLEAELAAAEADAEAQDEDEDDRPTALLECGDQLVDDQVAIGDTVTCPRPGHGETTVTGIITQARLRITPEAVAEVLAAQAGTCGRRVLPTDRGTSRCTLPAGHDPAPVCPGTLSPGGEGGMLIGPFAHDPDGDGEMPANVRPLHSPAFLAIHQDTLRGAALTIPGSAR